MSHDNLFIKKGGWVVLRIHVAPINVFWDALPNLNYAIVLFYVTLARVSDPMRIKINFMYVYKYFG